MAIRKGKDFGSMMSVALESEEKQPGDDIGGSNTTEVIEDIPKPAIFQAEPESVKEPLFESSVETATFKGSNTEETVVSHLSNREETVVEKIPESVNKFSESSFASPVQPTVQEPAPKQESSSNYLEHPGATNKQPSLGSISTESIKRIVGIVDLMRSYEPQVIDTIVGFLKLERGTRDESLIIYSVLNVEEKDKCGIKDLVSLKEEERTSRAFSLMGLSEDRLNVLKDLVSMFNSKYEPTKSVSDRVMFCRELEMGIETLENACLTYLKPINDLLVL